MSATLEVESGNACVPITFHVDSAHHDVRRFFPGTVGHPVRRSSSGKADVLVLDATDEAVGRVLERATATRAEVSPDCVLLIVRETSLADAIMAVRDGWVDRPVLADASGQVRAREYAVVADSVARLRGLRERTRAQSPDHVLMTGATGFLGRVFLRHLLACTDSRVTVLTRAARGKRYDERLPVHAAQWPDRLSFVEGDIRLPQFGLEVSVVEGLRDSVDEVWHLAADTRFEETLRRKTTRANVAGVRNLLELARGFPLLRCLNHTSTAYVSGIQPEGAVIAETVSTAPGRFRNPYEESKHEAERLVAGSGLPHAIYRPGIIIGDTVSGRSDGQTIYNIAKMVRLARLLAARDCERRGLPADHHSFRVVANTGAAKNLLPADHVAEMMLGIRAGISPDGGVYHVTHPEPTRIAEVVDAVAGVLRTRHYEMVSTLEGATLSVPERAMERVSGIFRPYMTGSDPVFDRTRARAALGEVSFPRMDRGFLAWAIESFYMQQFGLDYAAGTGHA